MRTFDFAPLYRHTVGFDRMATALDRLVQNDQNQATYPPFNIEKTNENAYRITLAVAGFTADELEIESNEGVLLIKGAKPELTEEHQEDAPVYLHRGIAARSFERRFQLADHVKVVDASLENGLLYVSLEREIPEALKPRKIEISGGKSKTKKIAKN